MPLSKQIAEKKAQESTVRVNPEIDAKLNRFIEENPDLHGYYNGLSKEQLIRKVMLGKMQKDEYSQRRNQEIAEWVEQHPEIKTKVEERTWQRRWGAPRTVAEGVVLGPKVQTFGRGYPVEATRDFGPAITVESGLN